MNKKFSTLMVGALLSSSVGAFAQGNKFGTTAFAVGNTEELSDAKKRVEELEKELIKTT